MPGTFVIDAQHTFATVIFMSCMEKKKFGSQDQEVSAAGLPKWTVEAAVTFHAENGMKPVSEVISITIAAPVNPAEGAAPGTPVLLEGLRVGISAPERNDKGGIRGGRPWYQASGLRPAVPAGRAPKSEAA